MVVIALYFASADDRDRVPFFFGLHEIRDSSSLIQYPVIDLQNMGQVPQSDSQKTSKLNEHLEDSQIPILGVAFKYLKILATASM